MYNLIDSAQQNTTIEPRVSVTSTNTCDMADEYHEYEMIDINPKVGVLSFSNAFMHIVIIIVQQH